MRTVIPIHRGQHSDDRGQFSHRRFLGSRSIVCVKLASLAGFFRWLAQGFAIEREAVCGVHDAVEDGIGDCRIDDHLVPVIDGELTRHDRRGAAVTIVNDFEQVATLL